MLKETSVKFAAMVLVEAMKDSGKPLTFTANDYSSYHIQYATGDRLDYFNVTCFGKTLRFGMTSSSQYYIMDLIEGYINEHDDVRVPLKLYMEG